MDANCIECQHLNIEYGVIGKVKSIVCNYPGKRRHLWMLSKSRAPVWCPLKKAEASDD